MPQSLAKVYVHIIFSTKNRREWLKDADIRKELYAYASTVLKNESDSPALVLGGVEDHIHILCQLSRKVAIMDLVKTTKTETTKLLKKRDPGLLDFQWQSGYGIFSVSQSNVDQVRQYISNQKQHHRKISFQEELRLIYEKHGIEIDERYVWD